jgi:hypothetical protein
VGSAHSATSYDQLNNQYGTLAAHDSAINRVVHEVSEQIVNRLSLYFTKDHSHDPDPKKETPADDATGATP